jgi:hypothetical protein
MDWRASLFNNERNTGTPWEKHMDFYMWAHVRIPNSISLFAMLGPEFEEQVDGRFTVTNGIPPVVRNMVQNEQEHKATRVELAKLKSDLGHLASSVLLPSSIVPLANWKNWLTQQTTLQQITTQGLTTVGPEQMQLMLTKAMQNNTHGNESLTNMENDIVTILQRHGVSPLSPDHDYNDDDDDNNSGPWALDVEEPSGADTMATIVRHDPTSYSWAHHDKKKRKKDKEIRFRKLPLDYKLHLKLSLSKVFQRFVAQSNRPIPRPAAIHRASAEFSLPSAQSHLKKQRRLPRWWDSCCAKMRRAVHWKSLRNQTQLPALQKCQKKLNDGSLVIYHHR